VVGHLAELNYRLTADVEAGKLLLPLSASPRHEDRLHGLVDADAILAFGKLELEQVWPAYRLAEGGPELRLEGANAVKSAVLALVDAVARVAAAQALIAPADALAASLRRQGKGEPADGSIHHRRVNRSSLSASPDLHKCSENGDWGLEAAASDIRHLDR